MNTAYKQVKKSTAFSNRKKSLYTATSRKKAAKRANKFVDESTRKRRKIILFVLVIISILVFLGYLKTKAQSTYDIWVSLGNTGTTTEFISSLRGDAGTKGESGIAGGSGDVGASSYEVWKNSDPSNAKKSETDFIKSLVGETGDKGPSSYETWKELSVDNKYGSESEYIKSLKGDKGVDGDSAFHTWQTVAEENADKTESDFFNSLKGDTGIQGQSSYETWKNFSIENSNKTELDFINSLKGEKGDKGDSAFTVWQESDPNNAGKTETDFISSLKGDKGDAGGSGAFKPGEIRLFGAPINDPNWILCDGQSYSVSKYPDLYNTLGSGRVPDLRGKILAMYDDNNPIGSYAGSDGLTFVNIDNLPTDEYSVDIGHGHGITATIHSTGLHTHEFPVPASKKGSQTPTAAVVNDPGGGGFANANKTFYVDFAGDHTHTIDTATDSQTNSTSSVQMNPLSKQGLNLKQQTSYGYYYIYTGDTTSK